MSTAVPGTGRFCHDLADARVTQGEISRPVVFHVRRVARCSMTKSTQEGEVPGQCWEQPWCSRQPPRHTYPQNPH